MTDLNPMRTEHEYGLTAVKDAIRVLAVFMRVAIVVLIVAFCLSGIRNLEQYESGIVLRFGAVHGEVREQPGLILALPYPIDEIIRIPAKRTQTLESSTFWYQKSDYEKKTGVAAGIPETLKADVDGYVLTSGIGVVHAKCVLKYRITDPVRYAFSLADLEETLRSFLDNSVLKSVANITAGDVLGKKNQIAAQVMGILREDIRRFNLGVEPEPVDLQLSWPRQITASINDVSRANQEYQQAISEAKLYANIQISEAESQVAKTVLEAETWATGKISRAEADAKTFAELYPLYRKNPDVIRQTLYQDRMRTIMENVDEVFVIDAKANREVRLQIPRNQRPSTPEQSDKEDE